MPILRFDGFQIGGWVYLHTHGKEDKWKRITFAAAFSR